MLPVLLLALVSAKKHKTIRIYIWSRIFLSDMSVLIWLFVTKSFSMKCRRIRGLWRKTIIQKTFECNWYVASRLGQTEFKICFNLCFNLCLNLCLIPVTFWRYKHWKIVFWNSFVYHSRLQLHKFFKQNMLLTSIKPDFNSLEFTENY